MDEPAQPVELCPACMDADFGGVLSRCYKPQGSSFCDQEDWLWKYGEKRDACPFCELMLAGFTSSKDSTDVSSLSSHGLRLMFVRKFNYLSVGVLYGFEEPRDMTSTGVALMDLGFVDLHLLGMVEAFRGGPYHLFSIRLYYIPGCILAGTSTALVGERCAQVHFSRHMASDCLIAWVAVSPCNQMLASTWLCRMSGGSQIRES
jgi:hypothetical protein